MIKNKSTVETFIYGNETNSKGALYQDLAIHLLFLKVYIANTFSILPCCAKSSHHASDQTELVQCTKERKSFVYALQTREF